MKRTPRLVSRLLPVAAAIFGALGSTWAGPRTSANYSILADTVDSGGKPASSANYSQIGSLGLLAGLSNAASGVQVNAGYVAQVSGDAVQALSAVSRKTHGAAGVFDVNLPLTGVAGVECRAAGGGGAYQVVMTFASPVSANSVSVMSRDGLASGSTSVSGAVVTINLTGVANAQTLGVTLLQVNNGSSTADVFIPMGVLLGDTNGNGTVSSSDIGQVKSQSGQAVSAANFRTDVNVSGTITSSDIGQVKSQSGATLP
ncbi:MAG: dockerin type I domain-containing protein [Chthoniobacterales bacterium]